MQLSEIAAISFQKSAYKLLVVRGVRKKSFRFNDLSVDLKFE